MNVNLLRSTLPAVVLASLALAPAASAETRTAVTVDPAIDPNAPSGFSPGSVAGVQFTLSGLSSRSRPRRTRRPKPVSSCKSPV